MVTFKVGVDSGTIEIALNPDHLDKGLDLYSKIQEVALETAQVAWDGKKGAIGTTHGDDVYTIIYDPAFQYRWKEWQDKRHFFLVNLPHKQRAKPFTLYCGDVGAVQGRINFPEHTLIVCAWEDENTLRFMSE